jgi:hypothetical protein
MGFQKENALEGQLFRLLNKFYLHLNLAQEIIPDSFSNSSGLLYSNNMAAAALDQQVDDPWKHVAAKRTAALPKHSLFGTL